MNQISEKPINTKKEVWPIIRTVIIYIFLIIWALIVLFPFYYMIITSFKTYGSYTAETMPKLYVTFWTFQNYVDAFTTVQMLKILFNSLFFSVLTTIITLAVIIPAAFAFARLKFKGKEIVFMIFLAVMMIPNELVIITNYYTTVALNWRNSFTGLIMPSVMSVFYIYFLRETFESVPDELYYAAKVDGTTDLGYMFKVMIPIAKPTIISIIILKVIECWNSYVWPQLITTEKSKFLVSQAIQVLRQSGNGLENIPLMMAAVSIVSVPIIILFIIFRRQIMAGVSRSGTKG